MSMFLRAVAFGSALLLAVALVAGTNPVLAFDDDKAVKEAQKDVVDLAKMIEDGKDGGTKVAAIKKKYEELNTVMHVYKPSNKGGLGSGIGPKGAGDGIEIKIINLGKGRGISGVDLKKDKAALVKLAYVNAAIADITMLYAPAKPKGGKGAKEWKQYATDMKKASMDLIKAVEAGKSDLVKTAANNLNNSCNNCHSDFRDS